MDTRKCSKEYLYPTLSQPGRQQQPSFAHFANKIVAIFSLFLIQWHKHSRSPIGENALSFGNGQFLSGVHL